MVILGFSSRRRGIAAAGAGFSPSLADFRPCVKGIPKGDATDVSHRERSHRCRHNLVGRRYFPWYSRLEKLHDYPQPKLTEEEQAFLDGPVEEACRMANDFQITHELADLPPELWAYLKEHRFFAMIIKNSTAV